MDQPQIEVRDLRLVQAIFSEKTTAAAAKVLGLTQSGVSHQLRNLEERLGLDVFERKGRNLSITEAGTKMLTAGRDILGSLSALESDLRRGVGAVPQLRVATQCYTAYGWLPRATVEMRDRGEELRIKPALPKAPTLQQALLDDEVDLALSLDAFDDARFCRRKLFEDELVLLTSLQHPLADRKWVRGADLVDCDLLMLEAARENGRRVGRVLFSPGAGFRSVSYLPLTEAILEMVRAGLGVSILPMWSCWSSIARRDVAWARLGKAGLRRKWVGAYRRDSPLAPSIRLLLSILKQQGAPLQRAQHDQVLSA